jgi:hypothetical protein
MAMTTSGLAHTHALAAAHEPARAPADGKRVKKKSTRLQWYTTFSQAVAGSASDDDV